MKSYIVEWVDWAGRTRVKCYVYRKWAEKLAISIALEGLYDDTYGVSLSTYERGHRVRHEVLKGVWD